MVVIPAFLWVWWVNRFWIPDPPEGMTSEEHREYWQGQLADASSHVRTAVGTVYEQSTSRLNGLEAKAIGLLTAVAILAAIASVACSGPSVAAGFGIAALVFLTFAGCACCWVLHPRSRPTLLLSEVLSSSAGVVEMAWAVKMVQPHSSRASNMVTSANYDLIRALVLTLVAITTFVFLRPTSGNGSPAGTTTTSVVTSTSTTTA